MSHNLVENLSLASVAPQPARPANTRSLSEVATFAKTLHTLARQEAGAENARRTEALHEARRPEPVRRQPEERPAQAERAPVKEQAERNSATPVANGRDEKPQETAAPERTTGAQVSKPQTSQEEGRPEDPPRAQVTLPAQAKGHAGQKEVEEASGEAEVALPLTDLVAELAAPVLVQPVPELAQTVSLTQQVDTLVMEDATVAMEGTVSLGDLVPIAEPIGEGEIPVLVPLVEKPAEEAEAPVVDLMADTVVMPMVAPVVAPVVHEADADLLPAVLVEQAVESAASIVAADLETEEPSVVPNAAPQMTVEEPVADLVEVPVVKAPEAAGAPVVVKAPEIVKEAATDVESVATLSVVTVPEEKAPKSEKPKGDRPASSQEVTPVAQGPKLETASMKEVVTQAQAERPDAGEGKRGIGETVSDFAKTKSIEHLLKPLRGEVVTERGPQVQNGPQTLPAHAKADPLQALVEQGKTVLLTVKPDKAADSSPVQAMVETMSKAGDLAEKGQGLELQVKGANDVEAVAVQVGADGAGDEPTGQDHAKFQLASAKEITTHMKIGNDSKVTAYSDRDVIQQVIERIKQAVNAGKSEVRLRLNPESLGEVHVRIISHQGQVTVRLLTDNPEVQKLMESGMGHLRGALADQGVKVNQLHVTQAQEDQQAKQQSQQQQEQQQAKEERQQKRHERDGVALDDFASMLAKEG